MPMAGRDMTMRSNLVAVASSLVLTACIPRGGDDFRIQPAPDVATQPFTPQMTPEQQMVAETPSWSPAVVERNARRVATTAYVVQPGDSLFGIAVKTGAGATAIADANNLKPPYPLRLGDRLQIPGGLYHRVGTGETGIAIARAYSVVWADIVMLNALQPPYTLQVGQNLLLPSATSTDQPVADASPESRAAAFTLNIDDIVTGGNAAGVPAIAPATPTNFAGKFDWPVRGNIIGRFGAQGGGRVNDGVNITAPRGKVVGAAAPGVVVYSGNEIGVFGGLVLIDHGGGWITAYGHLGGIDVAKGKRVAAGDRIGVVGDTGYVTQPQLHFQVRRDRKPVNPLPYMRGPNGAA